MRLAARHLPTQKAGAKGTSAERHTEIARPDIAHLEGDTLKAHGEVPIEGRLAEEGDDIRPEISDKSREPTLEPINEGRSVPAAEGRGVGSGGVCDIKRDALGRRADGCQARSITMKSGIGERLMRGVTAGVWTVERWPMKRCPIK